MVLNKKEKILMEVITKAAGAAGQCLLTPMEILAKIPLKIDFRESDIKPVLDALYLEGYFAYDVATRKDGTVYVIVLKEHGLAYERDKKKARKQVIEKIIISVIAATLGFLMKTLLGAIIP